MLPSHRAALVLLIGLASCSSMPDAPATTSDSDETPSFTPAEEDVLYTIGLGLGLRLEELGLDEAESEELIRGVVDGLDDPRGAERFMAERPVDLDAFWDQRLREIARIEEEASRPFLEAAAEKPGAERYESGMILTVLEEGEGTPPDTFDWVVLHFTGRLRDGTVFDASTEEKTIPRRVGVLVKCLQEALGASAQGARLRVVCPADLAYGHQGIPGRVPGGAVTVFDVEVLEVIPGEEPTG